MVVVVDHERDACYGHRQPQGQPGERSVPPGHPDGDEKYERRDGQVEIEVGPGGEVVDVGEVHVPVVDDGDGPGGDDGECVEELSPGEELGVLFAGPAGQVDDHGESDDHEGCYRDVMMSEYGEKKRRAQQEAVLRLVPELVGVEREGEEYEA